MSENGWPQEARAAIWDAMQRLWHQQHSTKDGIINAALAALAPFVAAREAAAAEAMRERKDAAYEERNRVVALLAAVFPSVRCRTAIEGWSDDWHGCVYITLPTGQASWHYHDSHAHLFRHVPEGPAVWDGHTTDEKYRRVADACTPDALAAERDALRKALLRWQHYGCPDCGGDCGSANPPVALCIMQETRAALAQKETNA